MGYVGVPTTWTAAADPDQASLARLYVPTDEQQHRPHFRSSLIRKRRRPLPLVPRLVPETGQRHPAPSFRQAGAPVGAWHERSPSDWQTAFFAFYCPIHFRLRERYAKIDKRPNTYQFGFFPGAQTMFRPACSNET